MATVTGSEYDHITISDGTNQTVHYLKDFAARTLLDNKADKNNTVITGSLSLGRKANTTVGNNSFAIGNNVEASGNYSHAEGQGAVASGQYSHAEGSSTSAIGTYSHAEGLQSIASGVSSHAEGTIYMYQSGGTARLYKTSASGNASHAEGVGTIASGDSSHSEGFLTVASHKSQHVMGECNIQDPSSASNTERGEYIEIVGNGISGYERSNARTLDWSGNERLAGGLTLGAGTANETSITASELAAIKSGGGGGGGSSAGVNFVTPEDYGAVGNGSTDDTTALTNAFNSGKPVVLTKGKNYFMMQLTVTHPLVLFGNQATISTRSITPTEYNNGGQRLLIFDDSATQVYIRDVNFYTTADQTIYGAHGDRDDPIPNRSIRAAIACYGVEKITVENCKFENFDTPIMGQRHGSDSTYQYIAKNGWFKDLQLHNSLMGFMGYFQNIVIDGCEIIEDHNARSGEHGIYLLVDALETCNIVSTNIYTYNGSCGSCIQFYPSSMSATMKTVDKREYRIDNCILIGDSYISNAMGGNVIASSCTMKTIGYSTENRRRQFECSISNGGQITVTDSDVNLELNDVIGTALIFRHCNLYSNRLMSDRFALYKAYDCQFDNIGFKLDNGGEIINCTFSSSVSVIGRYYFMVPQTTTSSYIIGCVFNSGSNVDSIAYQCAGTCYMIACISPLPDGSDIPGLVVSHKINPAGGDSSSGGLPAVSANDNGKVLRVVNGVWAAATIASASGVSF